MVLETPETRAVLASLAALGRATWEQIASASPSFGATVYYRRGVEPNVRTVLDRLGDAGLVQGDGYIAGKAAESLTDDGVAMYQLIQEETQ